MVLVAPKLPQMENLMDDRSLQIMARLRSQIAISDARMRSDPLPYLQEAHGLLSEAHGLLQDLEWVLDGMDSFDMISDIAPDIKPIDFNGEALLRCQKAKKMIRDFQAKR